jgi:hypothetical protein
MNVKSLASGVFERRLIASPVTVFLIVIHFTVFDEGIGCYVTIQFGSVTATRRNPIRVNEVGNYLVPRFANARLQESPDPAIRVIVTVMVTITVSFLGF